MSDPEAQVKATAEDSADARLELVCPSCQGLNIGQSKYCAHCGIRLGTGPLEEEAPPSKRATAPIGGDASEVRRGPNTDIPIADPLIGTIVAGRYRIIEPLGRGGMGVVYRVEHARIGKLMALKLLTGELSRDPEIVARFKREALMVSKLSNPNTVQVFDFGASEGLTYLAMEYLRGDDLGRIIRKTGPLSPERCIKVIIQICNSLSEAHAFGIVHRDLKPENIFLLEGHAGNDVVKVLDFGLAKLRESTELGEVTSRGAIVGTPYYMSPEQIRGEAADPRSDVYSLGALMYAALTGEPVFDAPRPMGVLTKHLTDAPVSPSSRFPELNLSSTLSGIVLRALEKDPARRFQNVQELQAALVTEIRTHGASTSLDLLLDSGQMHALTRAQEGAATRDEVEDYERSLRRRGLVTRIGLPVIAIAALIVAWQVFKRTTSIPTFDGREHEPNNTASEASIVPFGEIVRGQVGQRLDAERSDRDFFKIKIPKDVRRISLRTSALPNMALCTLVYRAGLEAPIGRYCSGAPARALLVSALEIEPGDYLLAVMQDRDGYAEAATSLPVIENISDAYELQVAPADQPYGAETEPNDTQKDANRAAPGAVFHGRLAWMRDVDVVCAIPGSSAVRFIVEDAPDGRARSAALQVTPHGGSADGIPVRLHRRGTKLAGDAKHDVAGAWISPRVDRTSTEACIELTLVANPWAPLPQPTVAPAGDEEYTVKIEAL